MRRNVLTEDMMADCGDEAERYLNGELNRFYEAMTDKHSDREVASGMVQCVLFMALGKIVKAETQGILKGKFSKADFDDMARHVNKAVDIVNEYRAKIRHRSGGEMN